MSDAVQPDIAALIESADREQLANEREYTMKRFASLYKSIYKVEPDAQELAQVVHGLAEPGMIYWAGFKSIMEQHPKSGKGEQVSIRSLFDAHGAPGELNDSVVWAPQVPDPILVSAVKFQFEAGKVTYESVDLPNLQFRWESSNGEVMDRRFTRDERTSLEGRGGELNVATRRGNVPVPSDVETVVKHPSTTTQDAMHEFIEKFAGAERVLVGKSVIIVDQAPTVFTALPPRKSDDKWADFIHSAPKSDAVSLIGQPDRPAETSDLPVS